MVGFCSVPRLGQAREGAVQLHGTCVCHCFFTSGGTETEPP
jgi:hypothetical protein